VLVLPEGERWKDKNEKVEKHKQNAFWSSTNRKLFLLIIFPPFLLFWESLDLYCLVTNPGLSIEACSRKDDLLETSYYAPKVDFLVFRSFALCFLL